MIKYNTGGYERWII